MKKRLYYFTSYNYGIDAIKNKEIKVCTFDYANDDNEHYNIYSSSCNNFHNDLDKHKNLLINKNGIICFSENWNNATMWGHYADNNKGICLGFDIELNNDNPRPVKYLNEKLDIDYHSDVKVIDGKPRFTDSTLRSLITENLFMKSADWIYEQEYRFYIDLMMCKKRNTNNRCLYFYSFKDINESSLELKEVLLGTRNEHSQQDIYNEIRNYANEKEILISKVERASNSYAFKRIKYNDKRCLLSENRKKQNINV